MDISLPVSDNATSGMFNAGASARSADDGKFSQTLSKEMRDPPAREADGPQAGSAQKTRQQTQATGKQDEHATADADQHAADADADATESTSQHTEKAAASSKGHRKSAAQGSEAAADATTAGSEVEKTPEQHLLQIRLNAAADGGQDAANDDSEVTATAAPPDQAATGSTSSLLANGSTNPALTRGNAIHNEIYRSVRAQTSEKSGPGTTIAADTLASGKSLPNSGKSLPVGKLDKTSEQLNNLLPAGAEDWKYTADSLITAVSDKAAKFDALNTRFNLQSAESFSLINSGAGKAMSAPASIKSEAALQDSSFAALASDHLAGSEEWCQDFGAKIQWMGKENVTKAELSLHPAELGILDITINTEDDRISINIVTHNEKSREMLESSMPRLNELLKSQGLALENSNISHNSASSQHDAHAHQQAGFSGITPDEQPATEPGVVRSALVRHHGQIDHYV